MEPDSWTRESDPRIQFRLDVAQAVGTRAGVGDNPSQPVGGPWKPSQRLRARDGRSGWCEAAWKLTRGMGDAREPAGRPRPAPATAIQPIFVLFKVIPAHPTRPSRNGSGTSSWEDLVRTGRVKIAGEDEEIARRLRTPFQVQESWKLDLWTRGAIHGASFVRRWPKRLRVSSFARVEILKY